MINIILAVDKNGCIGKNNSLCWNLKEDLKFFSEKTSGNVVIMGKNTYLSLPEKFRPLPNRKNIVVSSSLKLNEVDIVPSLEKAINLGKKFTDEIFIIGGKSMYEESIELVDRVYLTKVYGDYDCDVCLKSSFFVSLLDFKLSNILKTDSNMEIREYVKFTYLNNKNAN